MAKVFPLSEGVFTIGHDKVFLPFDADSDELNDRARGSLLVEVQPFLVATEKDLILLDTGLGFSGKDETLQIHHNIIKSGFQPSQVTKVLLTHLHKDHAGGATYKNEQGVFQPSFENADYYIYRSEAQYALSVGFPSYMPEEIEPLFTSGQVKWLEGATGEINENIRFEHSGGHCPEHIVFLLEEGEDKIFFGGDEAPQLKQMKIRYVAKYDHDGKKAAGLREDYAARGKDEKWQFLFYHDAHKPTAFL